MKIKFLTGIFLLGVLPFAVCKTYACNQKPEPALTITPPVVGLGGSVLFDGSESRDPDGGDGGLINGIKRFEWDYDYDGQNFTSDYSETPTDHPDGVFDGKVIVTYSLDATAKTYTIALRVTDNDKQEGGENDKSDIATCSLLVCKPINFYYSQPRPIEKPGYYGITFDITWGSSSGDLNDLTHYWLYETIGNFFQDSPPFYGDPPSAKPSKDNPMSMWKGAFSDNVGTLKECVHDYQDGWLSCYRDAHYRWGWDETNRITFSEDLEGQHVQDKGGSNWQIITSITHSCPGDSLVVYEDLP